MVSWQQLINNVSLPVEWVSVREVTEIATHLPFRDGLPQTIGQRHQRGIMVEVLAQGHYGYSSTNQVTPEGFARAVEGAYRQAIAGSAWKIHAFSPRPPQTGHYRSEVAVPSMEWGEICDRLIAVSQALKVNDRIVKTSAYAHVVHSTTRFVSSNGADITQQFSFVVTDLAATAQSGSIVQRRSDRGLMAQCRQGGWEFLLADNLLERAEQIGKEALELLEAPPCPDCVTTLVLAPDQMLLQIHESVGHPLEIDRVLGDERNYAGGSFLRPEDFGTYQYGSELMNITFDPEVRGEFATYKFDDVGQPAERQYLIKAGKLLRGLGGHDSQARSGIPGVANMRSCSWNRPPIDRMANINLEPGHQTLAELIADIPEGIYMESNRSWSIDDYRRKFQFGCEYGKLIQDGRLTKTVRNPNYRGITTQFWHNLIGISNTMEFYGSPFCGKGEPNQAIRVGHGSPYCVFANVEVFG